MTFGSVRWAALTAFVFIFSAVCGSAVAASEADGTPVPGPDFTQAQADAGGKLFASSCANCHGDKLQGAAGPALTGTGFIQKWANGSKPIVDFRGFIKENMPLTSPGSLSDSDYYDLTAFILSRNGYKAGGVPFTVWTEGATLRPPGSTLPVAVRPLIKGPLPKVSGTVLQASTNKPDDTELLRPSPSDWLVYNGNLKGQRYSTLDQINTGNASKLGVACIFQLGELGSFEAAPVVYDGMMYITSPWKTYAINPATCELIWTNSYPEEPVLVPTSLSRGVAIYRGKLFRVTPTDHLIAIDAKTGGLLWDSLLADQGRGYSLTAAPVAYDGRVFIGLAGADDGADGKLFALDAETGKLDWTFDTIPQGNEVGAESWKKGAEHGGGSSWSTYTIDPAAGLLFASIGNPAPDFNPEVRPGDNLFTDSVVALDYKTGKLNWWVQQVPHDTHDWDTAAAPTLYEQDGKAFMAVANKGGWLYLYNRATHDLLAKPEVSRHLNVDTPLTVDGVHHCPGLHGGVEWNGVAYSPKDQLIYMNSTEWCATTHLKPGPFIEGQGYFNGRAVFDPIEQAFGWTKAFNAVSGAPVWSRKSKTPMVAAVTPTAGGVLFTGDLNGEFVALDSRTGDTLYKLNTGGAVAGAPSTYMVDGNQYVAITSGNLSRTSWQTRGAMTVVVFSLPKQ